jgi:hypothetical protein
MTISDNTSETPNLLSARNVILAAAALLVLSVLGSCLSMLRPPDSGGYGRDSFGTRRGGFRALVDMLTEFGIPVARDLAPPQPGAADQHTLALLDPDPHLVDYGPKYIQGLAQWVEQGGRLVITPSSWRQTFLGMMARNDEDHEAQDVREVLALDNAFNVVNAEDNGTDYLETESESYVESGEAAPRVIQATGFSGSLGDLEPLVKQLAVPGDGFDTLEPKGEDTVAGTLTIKDSDGTEHVVAAAVARGKGEIIVLSDARLLSNALIAQGDNSVFAMHLLSPDGREVVFDEFYHGLAVRGNPLYLLTRPGFAAITLGLLASVGLWAWRSAVFLGPPLEQRPPSRRDIRQYVDAMGDFFARGSDHRRFVAREVRDGILHQLCEELKLPADTTNVETIVSALRRRNPQRAERVAALVAEVGRRLDDPSFFRRADFLTLMQRLAGSL